MSEELKPNQAMFLWRMIAGQTPDVREPMKSKAKPDLNKKDRQMLLSEGYLIAEKRGRADYFVLTDKAWAWAERSVNVDLLKSRSSVGAEALEGLLHRLLPYLKAQEIPLAALFASPPTERTDVAPSNGSPEPTARAGSSDEDELWPKIERACLHLSNGRRQVRVLLRKLRAALPDVERDDLDRALVLLQREGRLVLYREDNSAALTPEDISAALIVGDAPRHLVYLENSR